MFVTVIHRIHDPEGFQAAETKALEAGLPSTSRSDPCGTPDNGLGICIWEGESVEAVREVVEAAVGAWANNEYARCTSTASRRSSESNGLIATARADTQNDRAVRTPPAAPIQHSKSGQPRSRTLDPVAPNCLRTGLFGGHPN